MRRQPLAENIRQGLVQRSVAGQGVESVGVIGSASCGRQAYPSFAECADSSNFHVRSKAEADLEEYGESILAEVEGCLKSQKNTLEKKRRLEVLLAKARKAAGPFGTPERIGQWRSLEVIERIGAAEAKQFLRTLADGVPRAHLTLAARAALLRMKTRP